MTARRSTCVMPDGMPMTTRVRRQVYGPCALRMKLVSIRSAASKSAITPSRIGRIVVMRGRRAAEHRARRVTDGFGLVALRVDGDDRRFVDDDAAAGGEDDGVGGAEVDGEVAGPEGQDVQQHGLSV